MLSLLYPISYLACMTGLILWFYFEGNRSRSRAMSSLFLVSFFIYLIALAFSSGDLAYKLLILFRDLMVLAAASQVFRLARRHQLLVLVLAITLYGFMQFFGFNMLINTFPQIRESASPLDDEFELLVETREGDIPAAYARIIEKYGLTAEPAFRPADPTLSRLDEFWAIGIPDAQEDRIRRIVRDLRRISATRHIEYNEALTLDDKPSNAPAGKAPGAVNDPMADRQWGWQQVGGDALQAKLAGLGLRPVKPALIAILDSGVDAAHEDLQAQFRAVDAASDDDPVGHGTHCAGIAAAVSNNGKGVASLSPGTSMCVVTSVKVLNAYGMGQQRKIIQGILKAADAGAAVISLSLGGPSSDDRQKAYAEAVRYANAKGAIVVVAAGNSSTDARHYAPANTPGVITVSALGTDLKKAGFSNTVDGLRYGVAAPGTGILSTYPGGQYKAMDGTSMATPQVSGLIGLLKAVRPELTTAEVYDILHDTGTRVPDERKTGRMVQALPALERVLD